MTDAVWNEPMALFFEKGHILANVPVLSLASAIQGNNVSFDSQRFAVRHIIKLCSSQLSSYGGYLTLAAIGQNLSFFEGCYNYCWVLLSVKPSMIAL